MRSIKQLMDLRGRVAVITGGAGHIGTAAVEALAEAGADVALVDLQTAKTDQIISDLQTKFSVRARAIAADLADESQVRRIAPDVLREFGRIDILMNCAALVGTSELKGWGVPFAEQSAETWRKALEVNLTAAFVLTQTCAEALAASAHGSVINFGSIYGLGGPHMDLYAGTKMGNPAAYAASKGGLIQLTRWLATVMAPAVRVNCISPGGVLRGQADEFRKRYVAHTPLARMATEEDLKGAVVFLASDMSAYVTGQNLLVDGGWSAW